MHPRDDRPPDPPPVVPDPFPLGRWPSWLLLCGFWAVPAFFEVFQYYLSLAERGLSPTWLHAAVRASVRWGLWALLTPVVLALARRMPLRNGLPRVLAFHVVAGAAVTAVQLVALAVVFEFAFYSEKLLGWPLGYTIYRVLLNSFGISLTAYWFIVAVYYAFDYYREAQERAVAAARLEASLSQARLEALRMQLNPHFLFNTLHAISTLSLEGKRGATTRMLMLLSDLLRLTLRRSGQFVPLQDELDLAGRYLEIEKVRFEDRLEVKVEVDPGLLDAEVPTFLLQPILENAIRHGIAAEAAPGTIAVTGRRSGHRLVLQVRNSGGPPASSGEPTGLGIGLSNTYERLRCLYADDFRLELAPGSNGGAVTTVDLPFRRQAEVSRPTGQESESHGGLAFARGHVAHE